MKAYGNGHTLYDGTGGDTLEAHGSGHTLYGDAGNDIILSYGDGDFVYGGDGNDNIRICDDVIDNADGNGFVIHGANQHVYGEDGNDTITIQIPLDNHTISGGKGSDKFIYDTIWLGSNHVITFDQTDYNSGDVDVLELKNSAKNDFTYSYDAQNGEMTMIGLYDRKIVIKGWDVNP